MDFISAMFITIIIIGVSMQGVLKKGYSQKVGGGGVFTFSTVGSLCACLFFLVKALVRNTLVLDLEILPFALLFAAAYISASVFNMLAIQTGSLSLTSLFLSYSLIIPTVYGLIFDGDEAGLTLFLGLGFLALSIALINTKKGETKITGKWVLFALLSFIGNGLCSTVQPEQTEIFSGKYDDSFMVIALVIVFLFNTVMMLTRERREAAKLLKQGLPMMIGAGVFNGVVNMLTMAVTAAGVSKSLMFPLISAGGIVLTWVISLFFYKEKLTAKQNIGMVLGVISIVFLNL